MTRRKAAVMTKTDIDMANVDMAGGRGTNLKNLATWLGILGIIGSLLWGAWVLWHLSGDFDAMPRTEIPGEVTVNLDEPGERVVYYERNTLVATPVEPGIEVSVTGPDGSPVVSEPTTRVQYRTMQTVRQPHVSFPVTEPGSYTVTASGNPADDGATLSVGPRVGLSSVASLSGPVVALLAAVALAAWGIATRRGNVSSDVSVVR